MNEKFLIDSGTGNNKIYALMVSASGIIFFLIGVWFAYNVTVSIAILFYIIATSLALFGVLYFMLVFKCHIVVTDKRVFGVAGFGRRVDLPLDSISAVAIGSNNSISISTSSGQIGFVAISRRDEVFQILSGLLIERQNARANQNTTVIQSTTAADELKKYKELLDDGVISQEEFDVKKKQLLDL